MKASSFVFCLVLLLVSAAQADDSLNVRLVGSCHTPGPAYGVAVQGTYAFVADFDAGLRVISVADPAHPTEVGHVDTPDSAVRVVVSGNYAYVVGVQAGLRVISVADPANPIEVGSYDTPGRALGVAVGGDYAYLVDRDSGLLVISIADPAHPTMVGHWNVSGSMVADIAVAGHFVYVVDYLEPNALIIRGQIVSDVTGSSASFTIRRTVTSGGCRIYVSGYCRHYATTITYFTFLVG